MYRSEGKGRSPRTGKLLSCAESARLQVAKYRLVNDAVVPLTASPVLTSSLWASSWAGACPAPHHLPLPVDPEIRRVSA